eukprot:s1163_g19.t1
MFGRSEVRWLQAEGLWQQGLSLLENAKSERKHVDAVTYGALVGACARGQQWRPAVALLSEAESCRLHLNVVTCNMAMGACATAGEWQVALDLLSDVVASAQPDLVTYNAAINACKEASTWHSAMELFEDLQVSRFQPDAFTLGVVVSVAPKHERARWEVSGHRQWSAGGDAAVAYNRAAYACAKSDAWEQALEVLCTNTQKQVRVRSYSSTYNALIGACARQRQWLQALGLLSMAREQHEGPDLLGYNIVMASCNQCGRWEQALGLSRMLLRQRLHEDATTLQLAVSAAELGSLWLEALQTLGPAISTCASQAAWQAALYVLRMPEAEVRGSVIVQTKAISACARSLLWQRALSLGHNDSDLDDPGGQPDMLMYMTWMGALEREAEWQQAVLLLDGLVHHRLVPDSLLWSSFVKTCENAGPPALYFLSHVDRLDGDDAMLIMAITAMGRPGKKGEWEQALHVLYRQVAGANASVHNAAMSACSAASQWERGLLLFALMSDKQVKMDAITFGAAMRACSEAGAWHLALEIFGQMDQMQVERDAISFNIAMGAMQPAGQWQRALTLFWDLRATTTEPDQIAYASCVRACAEDSCWQRGLELLFEAGPADLEESLRNAAINACGKGGQWHLAMQLLADGQNHPGRVSLLTYNAVMSACGVGSEPSKAMALFQRLPEQSLQPDEFTYATVMEMSGASALALLNQLEMDHLQPSSVVCTSAMQGCSRGLLWQEAVTLFSRLQETSLQTNLITFNTLLDACANGGEWKGALQVLSQLRDAMLEASGFSYIAVMQATARANLWETGLHILADMEEQGINVAIFWFVFVADLSLYGWILNVDCRYVEALPGMPDSYSGSESRQCDDCGTHVSHARVKHCQSCGWCMEDIYDLTSAAFGPSAKFSLSYEGQLLTQLASLERPFLNATGDSVVVHCTVGGCYNETQFSMFDDCLGFGLTSLVRRGRHNFAMFALDSSPDIKDPGELLAGSELLSWVAYTSGGARSGGVATGKPLPGALGLLWRLIRLCPQQARRRDPETGKLPLHDAAWGHAPFEAAVMLAAATPSALTDSGSSLSSLCNLSTIYKIFTCCMRFCAKHHTCPKTTPRGRDLESPHDVGRYVHAWRFSWPEVSFIQARATVLRQAGQLVSKLGWGKP